MNQINKALKLGIFVITLVACFFTAKPSMAALSLIRSGSATTTNGNDVTVALTGASTGDLVIFFGGHGKTGTAIGPSGPSLNGYTLISSANRSGTGPEFGAWYKVMGVTPDSTVVGEGGGQARDGVAYAAYVLRGQNTSTTFDATATTAGPSASTNPNPPAITTVTKNTWVVAVAGDTTVDTTPGTIANYTNHVVGTGNDSDDITTVGATRLIAGTGTEDPGAWSSFSTGSWYAITIAVRKAATPPTVSTQAVSDVSFTTGSANGNIVSIGDYNVTRRGFAYILGTSGNPTTSDSVFYQDGDFSGTGAYILPMSGLSLGTSYRVRAYAVNEDGTSYGDTVDLTTLSYTAPTVTTQDLQNVSFTSGSAFGNITSIGGHSASTRGFVYMIGTSAGDPTLANSVVSAPGTFGVGSYSYDLTGLTSGTAYRVRAFAINETGTGYGNTVDVTTLAYSAPTVTTQAVQNITQTSGSAFGNITSIGGYSASTRGFVYMIGTSAGDPTLANSVVSAPGTFGVGSYSMDLTTLTAGTAYRVRAFAINTLGTSYGNTVDVTTLVSGITISGTLYQTDEATAYQCATSGTVNINLRVDGAGSYIGACSENTGYWQVVGVAVNAGQTIVAYTTGGSMRGSTVLVSNSNAQTDVPIGQNRVLIRDDVNASITNTEIGTGDTVDADDLIAVSGGALTVNSSYEIHIYPGDTFAPGGNVTTGKLHVVGNYTGSAETLTLTGAGTGTSRPLYIDGGTFTVPATVQFQGSGASDINNLTYTDLNLNPTITTGITYTFLGATSVNGDLEINPTSTGSNALHVDLGGDLTVASTGKITITGTTSGTSVLDTVSGSNYGIRAGFFEIGSAGTFTPQGSTITLIGTTGTPIFTQGGTFTPGTSTVIFSQTSGDTTLTSGATSFNNVTISMSGRTGAVGNNTTVLGNLDVQAGTLSIPSTYALSVTGTTSVTGNLTMSSTGNQMFTGATTINSGGTLTRSNVSGTNTFVGLLTVANGGTFTTSNNPGFYLRGGLSNSGTFTSGTGTYTFDTNSQSISGSAATSFGGAVAIVGAITLQNSNTNTVTVTGDLTGSAGGSTYQNNANTTTIFKTNVFPSNGTLIANANPNTITYDGDTTNDGSMILSASYHNLNVSPSRNASVTQFGPGNFTINGDLNIGDGEVFLEVETDTNDPNISVAGNLTVYYGTTFTNTDDVNARLNIDGDLTITGTFTAPRGMAGDSFTLAGDFIKTGTFNHNDGQLIIDGTGISKLDYGSDTTFYILASFSGGKTIQFDETYTTIVASLYLTGTDCGSGKLFLDSIVNDNPWSINITSDTDILYVDVEDSDASSSDVAAYAYDSTQTGSNPGWTVDKGGCALDNFDFNLLDLSAIDLY